MMKFYYWVSNNIAWFAVFVAAVWLLLDLIDAYAKLLWWRYFKKKSPIREGILSGRPSNEHLGHLTFKLYTTKHDMGPIEGWGDEERTRLYFILVQETLLSRLRRRITFAKAPTEMQFVEVAHRRIIEPQQGHIASFAVQEFQTLFLRRTGFYRVTINTNRENLSPGRRVQLECGATIVKMGAKYINEDNTPDGRVTLGS